MLASLEQTEIRARDRLKGIQPTQLWLVVQGSIHAVLSALVLVVGFASFTRRRGWEGTLLQRCQHRFLGRRGASAHSPSRRKNRNQQENPEDYLRSLIGEEAEAEHPSEPK
jgi:hypothetical protein